MSDFKTILEPIAEMLEKKNHDYGDSYKELRKKYGVTSFHIRVADKLNRIEQLDKDGAKVSESREDTIKDIIGYCVLELRYMQGLKPQKEAEDYRGCSTCDLLESSLCHYLTCMQHNYKHWRSKGDK